MADNFADREQFEYGSIWWNNNGYTTEPGIDPGGRQATAWFKWVCPAGMTSATFGLWGSEGDSYIHVYSYISSTLALIASNDDSAGGQDGYVTITVTPGVEYAICASMYGSDRGWQHLSGPEQFPPSYYADRSFEYVNVNVGMLLVPEDEAYEYSIANVGINPAPASHGMEYALVGDVGVENPVQINVGDGDSWELRTLRYWNGMGWTAPRPMWYWDGEAWVNGPGIVG